MKKINKLIPLGIVGATTSVICPTLLTSCSQDTMLIADMKDFDKDSVEAVPGEVDTYESIDTSRFYANRIKENPEIFAKDIFYAEKLNYDLLIEKGVSVKKDTISVSSVPKLSEIVWCEDGHEFKFPTISFKYSWESEYSASETQEKTKMKAYSYSKQTVEYKNVPFLIFGEGDDWKVSSFANDETYAPKLMFLRGWSMTCDVDYVETIDMQFGGSSESTTKNIKNKVTFDSFRELSKIYETLLNDFEGDKDRALKFFNIFTGSFSFISRNMTGVKIVPSRQG